MSIAATRGVVVVVFSILATLFAREPSAAAEPEKPAQQARRLAGEAQRLLAEGRREDALQRARDALALAEQQLGAESPRIFPYLQLLAGIYWEVGDQNAALSFDARMVQLVGKARGTQSLEFASALNDLAFRYQSIGAYERATRASEQSLAVLEQRQGPEGAMVAAALDNLAGFYLDQGDALRAERTYLRSIEIREKIGDGPGLNKSLLNLMQLYGATDDTARAVATGERAVALLERAHGPNHLQVAAAVYSLGTVCHQSGDSARAEAYYQRSLSIREAALGPDHAEVATSLNALGELYDARGDFTKARSLLVRALTIRERALAPNHPFNANTLINLAYVENALGDSASAEARMLRAIEIRRTGFGGDSPEMAEAQSSLAELYAENGQDARAIRVLEQAGDTRERATVRKLSVGSGEQKRRLLASYSGEMIADVVLALRANDPATAKVGLTEVLRHKGRPLDAMADVLHAVRRKLSGANLQMLDELQSVRTRLATQGMAELRDGTPAQAENAGLLRREQELEESLSRASATYLAAITLDGVQQAVPRGTALVEWTYYRPLPPKGTRKRDYAAPRIAAAILTPSGPPSWVDLGEANVIAEAVNSLRSSLSSPTGDPKQPARKLESLVFAPIRARLGKTRTVFLAPDGVLGSVPFGALVDDAGHYLLEDWQLSYLTSGRDLLRFREHVAPRSSALVVADPAFADRPETPTAASLSPASGSAAPVRTFELTQAAFSRLPGTAEEARAISKQLGAARVLTGASATETAIKRERGPRVLHIATHAFFVPRPPAKVKLAGREDESASAQPPVINPFLRSGLALAGANVPSKGDDDGLLTALEVSSLDLSGTKLVVLSACETGLGDLTLGEGVQGLRAALALSGSETQVLSLWDVNDSATRELMVGFYERLRRGEGRAPALRHAQLALMANPAYAHPNYWAAFIVSGDPTPVDLGSAPGPAKVPPRARGCACSTVGSAANAELDLSVMLCGALLGLRRLRASPKTPPVARRRIRFAILRCASSTYLQVRLVAAPWLARVSLAGSVRGFRTGS